MPHPTRPARALAFLEMHHRPRGFVMPNAWDAGSAIVLASEGFAALGTTSAGIAFSLGKPDYRVADPHLAVDRADALEALRRIASAVPVPVNADLEAGYGDAPEAVADTVRRAIAAGAAGGNIEDVAGDGSALFDTGAAAERIAAARAAIRATGEPFVLNARTDVFLLQHEDALGAAIERGRRFIEAGADCVFVPGVTDAERARALVRGIPGPVNLVAGLGEAASDLRALLDAGVRRISVGGSIARAALGLVRQAARELRAERTVSYAAGQIPQSELNTLFSQARQAGAQ